MIGDKLVLERAHYEVARYLIDILQPQIMKNPGRFVIVIAGESGSGKSEIATVLARLLNKKSIPTIIIQQDDYFVYPPKTNERMRRENIHLVGIAEVHLSLLDRHLNEIIEGKTEIIKPLVMFGEDRITDKKLNLAGVKVVIVDGTYSMLLKNVHMRIFIDRTYLNTREIRKYRAREKQDAYLERILDLEHRIISPQKAGAEIIITSDYHVLVKGPV
jgi:uridine kinase